MKLNPDNHNRQLIRLKWYDYSKACLYFITISLKDKLCLLWKIKDSKLELFESWNMIKKYWLELDNKFKSIKLHKFVIMPNHFHWIIEIIENDKICDCKICRGAPCGYPEDEICPYNKNILWNII